jgi:hypothetical protein
LDISNRGAIKFELEEPIDILGAIAHYNQFQKVLQSISKSITINL